MTVKELKEMLVGQPDEMQVIVPMNAANGFDGVWFSPCVEESGEGELGLEDLDEEEIKERELLARPPETEKAFILIPCGFFEKKAEQSIELN